MRNTNSGKLLMLTLVITIVMACSTAPISQPRETNQAASSPRSAIQADNTKSSIIRSIDFANFTYPWVSDFGEPHTSFTLVRGKYSGSPSLLPMDLFSVTYADVTGDSLEDGIVVLSVLVERAPAAPHAAYLYAIEKNKPRLLWAFATGDRSDGGLRRIYGDDGKLLIELYGKGKVVGADLYADDGSDAEVPYPYYFTRTRYEWTGTKFQQIAPSEMLSDPDKYGAPIMRP